MKKYFRGMVCITLFCLICQAALADDLNEPPWRGQPGTTLTEWTCGDSNPNPLPVYELNPNGDSVMSVYPGVGQEWWNVWGGRQGVWPLSGTIEIEIPNYPIQNPYKEIWVQLTWAPQAPDTYPIVSEQLTATPGSLLAEVQLEPTLEPPPADDFWYHSTFVIHLEPNPAFEIVRIDGAIMVDQIVIDTICAPEPVTLVMLGIGGLLLRRKR